MIIDALKVSLKVVSTATVFSFILGVLGARLMAKKNIRFKGIIELFLLLPVFLPPSVVGYLILIFLGKNGPIYKWFNYSFVFTWQGAAIASFIVSVPIMYQSAKAAFIGVDKSIEDSARVMGANEKQVFLLITLPMCMKQILSGVVLSFGRAFGEFGATLMVAGNIRGKTQTITTAMYYAVESGDKATSNTLLYIILAISFTLIFLLNFVIDKK